MKMCNVCVRMQMCVMLRGATMWWVGANGCGDYTYVSDGRIGIEKGIMRWGRGRLIKQLKS